MYGSPLPGFGSEAGFVLAYLASTAGMSFAAALLVFPFPRKAMWCLRVGASTACVIAGRYLFAGFRIVDPIAAIAAFGVPSALLFFAHLLQWAHPPSPSSYGSERIMDQARRPLLRVSIRYLFVVTSVIGLALGFATLSKPPPDQDSVFMRDIAEHLPPIETHFDPCEAGRDGRSVLRNLYHVELVHGLSREVHHFRLGRLALRSNVTLIQSQRGKIGLHA